MKYLILCVLPFVGHCMLISSPFDNFRIECPQNSGTQRLSIKMVESQGMKRQDTVFALSCNKIDEIYPWTDIPQGVIELEREDCHYTYMFDPIMDTNVNYTCDKREYLAGITRVTDTRIQTMCCRLRTRDEANCENVRFGKPLGYDGKVEIQLKGKLINALTVEKNLYKIRFCDLVPRAIGMLNNASNGSHVIGAILSDIKTTTTILPVTSTKSLPTIEQTTSQPLTSAPIISNQLANEKIKEEKMASSGGSVELPIKELKNTIQESSIEREEARIEGETIREILEASASVSLDNNTSVENFHSAGMEEVSAEEKVLSPSIIPQFQNSSTSLEVQASPMPQENMFPTDKDYENIEEAEAELMTTIAEMIKARNIAKNIISKVKAAGVKQQVKEKQEQMAEQLIKEIEGETDPTKADQLFKQSIEMLNELSEAKQIMSNEEFSNEMMKQEKNTGEDFEPIDSFEHDVFDSPSNQKLNISLPPSITNTNFQLNTAPPPPSLSILSSDIMMQKTSQTMSSKLPAERNWLNFVSSPPPATSNNKITKPFFLHSTVSLTTISPPSTIITFSAKNSQNTKEFFEPLKIKPVFLKKHKKAKILKPSVENGPSKEVLLAASSSNEARRAPAKYFEEALATLPPLNNFPSPPSSSSSRTRSKKLRPLELPRIPHQEEEYQPPIIELDEYDELLRSTTPYPYSYKNHKKHNSIQNVAANARGNFVDQPYVDELTRNSPFETSYENRIAPSKKTRSRLTTTTTTTEATSTTESTTPADVEPFYETSPPFIGIPHDKSPFDYPEIRRSPIPRSKPFEEYKKYEEIKNDQAYLGKKALDTILTESFQSEVQLNDKKMDEIDTKDGEGVISYVPSKNKEMEIKKAAELLVEGNQKEIEYQNEQQEIDEEKNQEVETLVPMNAVDEMIENNVTETLNEETPSPKPLPTNFEESTTSSTVSTTEAEEYYAPEYQNFEPEPPTYDPRAFFHTLPPRPITKKSRYLTFCTKDLAIRDSNNMIVACGSDNEVWVPKRCPEGTDCFYTTDSTFRICCPVAEG